MYKLKYKYALPLLSILICIFSCTETNTTILSQKSSTIPEIVDFNFHVKPILSDRCFKCHGPDKQTIEAGLSFATAESAFTALGDNKDHYAILPYQVDSSTLIHRIYTDDPDDIMPPPESNLSLTKTEKEILKKWIAQGAQWKEHWSLIPPIAPETPTSSNQDWEQNEIDAFVLKKLDQQGLYPNKPASKEKLLRRISFDLTGLPPSLEDLNAFLTTDSPTALAEQIDRLLATDAYAEHMTVIWLDLARYADSHGYQDDFERIAWPWRDWVIKAYKENMPYDQFVTWQLAGDLLPEPTREQLIATTFNRNHKITFEGGVIPEEYRVEYVADRTHTFGTAFLGLTMECARCHDHKYDPIAQEEYYQLFSYFNNVPEIGLVEPVGTIPEPFIELTKSEIEQTLTFINNRDTMETIQLMIMKELDKPRPAFILKRGAYDKPTTPVQANTPKAVLVSNKTNSQNRKDLAEWLFKKEHPLTARVAVNRLWQQLFGQGLVTTPDDFGNQGALPTHPELLDFLALKFQNENWNIKRMLKYIVSSATYQQSAKSSAIKQEIDPTNQWLARASRIRLSAEMIRDHALASSGLLVREIGGPSVKPYQPEGLWAETIGGGGGSLAKYVPDEGKQRYRRSLYTFWKRTVPPPSMMVFDAASRDLCTVKRQRTSTPLQALVLLNDPQIVEATTLLAQQAITIASTPSDRIKTIFRLATSRIPKASELKELAAYLEEELAYFEAAPDKAKAYLATGVYTLDYSIPDTEMAAYAMLASAVFNLDESISRG